MPEISGYNVSCYLDTFWFFYRQDVFLSDKNSFVVILSANQNLAFNFRSVPPLKMKGYRILATRILL